MKKNFQSIIIGSGSYLPPVVVENSNFMGHRFYDPVTREPFDKENQEIIEKFREITNISERRYCLPEENTSELGYQAALDAITSSGIDPESLDFIIAAHNFGDIDARVMRSDIMPGISARIKQKLGLKNPSMFTNDVIAGCPGWVQALIIADLFLKSGQYQRGLVVGTDVNSRAADPYDRDSMIFADGAGAVILEARETEEQVGILSHAIQSDTQEAGYLTMDHSLNPGYEKDELFIRMQGHKVYVYALTNVPKVVKRSLQLAGLTLTDVKKVLIHQANEKMDQAILERVFRLYKIREIPEDVMPMTISFLGNSSSATVPTLYDLIAKHKLGDHRFESGDVIVLTSVGAGMMINSVVYKLP
ncbi:MAG TPA: ketoacyl-ACP synthase III [Prolixibacteraceae bacterium]|nr:ketoacyl-ACP synthase III [Prolixibacteraceae bacterium]